MEGELAWWVMGSGSGRGSGVWKGMGWGWVGCER